MNNSSDSSSFSFFPNVNKRRQQFKCPLPPQKRPRNGAKIVKDAVLYVKTLGLPLISRSTGQFCEFIRLEPFKPCTIGRRLRLCDFIFGDRRVSKIHCQLYFDCSSKKIYLSDGLFVDCGGGSGCLSGVRTRVSTNGVFVNGASVSGAVELQVGDVVGLVCGNGEGCGLGTSIGFLVEKVVFTEKVDDRRLVPLNSCGVHGKDSGFVSGCCGVIDNTRVLLSWCRDILCSDEPVSCIRKCIVLDQEQRIDFAFRNVFKGCSGLLFPSDLDFCKAGGHQIECRNRKRVYSREVKDVENDDAESQKDIIVVPEENPEFNPSNDAADVHIDIGRQKNGCSVDIEQGAIAGGNSTLLPLEKQDCSESRELLEDNDCGGCILPPGKKFYLNRLQFMGQDTGDGENVVSLPELFHPVESLQRVFIATFTSDILWFLLYCKIPPHLPVTIACHSAEKCWSSDPDRRTSVPFSDFPNLTVVYPPFPEVIAFNKDRKNSGIACHHPKLIVLQREDNLRVVLTSANLVAKQWHNVTNTVWWQDFPRLSIPDCLSIFTQLSEEINLGTSCDFAAQLAGFMASLVADVPSQAHWILELIKYDFKEASGYLVASVPGIHSPRSLSVFESKHHLVGNRYKLKPAGVRFLSTVEASVVGLSHVYRMSADCNGEQLKKLALFLGKCHENMDGMSEIILRRETNIPADGNAVSVLIPNPDESSLGDFVQLGFLPRNVAQWVAPLSDIGLFAFSAYIHPKEVLATALDGSNSKVKLILYVYAGPSLSIISEVMQPEYVSAICSLVASSQRYAGLWRLKEILDQYKWPEHLESEFFYGASSIGCINAQFLAAFSAAAGKRSLPFSDSEESDPDWGCWSASQELKNPSVRIIFPSIERVKRNRSGIMASRRLLCFSEKTWERLKTPGLIHDAIPFPSERNGFPMHVKVGRRRFKAKDGSSFGWVYCGSHNFSAAAWGLPISDAQSNGSTRNSNPVLGSRLRISNYELGIVFIVPPPGTVDCVEQNIRNLDDIGLPFVVPPPKYGPRDKPATARAMREAWAELLEQERETNELAFTNDAECVEEEIAEEEEEEVLGAEQYVTQEKEDEKAYADKLWSQVDSSESC